MKRNLTNALILMLCTIFCAVSLVPVHADEWASVDNVDIEKLLAFYNQPTNSDGKVNGDNILDYTSFGYTPAPYSPNDYALPLAFWGFQKPFDMYGDITFDNIPQEDLVCFSLSFLLWGGNEAWDVVTPDLYGPLDLSETSVHLVDSSFSPGWFNSQFGTPLKSQAEDTDNAAIASSTLNPTHIESIDVSNCGNLSILKFSDQPYCTELIALDCPELTSINAESCDYRRITVQAKGMDAPLEIITFGNGDLDFRLTHDNDGEAQFNVQATCHLTDFGGWYSNGEIVSHSKAYNNVAAANGGEYIALFAGDVDDDSAVTVSDALLIVREAIGVGAGQATVRNADADCNGYVTVSDATMVARLCLGLY